MATYKAIQGQTVQVLASDPGASADTEGQIWYNSTTGLYKLVADDGGVTVKMITAT